MTSEYNRWPGKAGPSRRHLGGLSIGQLLHNLIICPVAFHQPYSIKKLAISISGPISNITVRPGPISVIGPAFRQFDWLTLNA